MRALVFAALAVAALLLCLSCTTGTDGDDGVPHDQTTVMGTLLLFVDVWNDCDIETYKGLLDENFTFYFDDMDVDGDIPTSWHYDEEIAAVGNLFDALGAENVDVQLDLDGVAEPEEGVVTYKVEEIPYEVWVQVDEEDIIYLAEAQLDMEFTKVDGQWIIINWWDMVDLRLLGCETSWGAIKAAY